MLRAHSIRYRTSLHAPAHVAHMFQAGNQSRVALYAARNMCPGIRLSFLTQSVYCVNALLIIDIAWHTYNYKLIYYIIYIKLCVCIFVRLCVCVFVLKFSFIRV